MASAHPSLKKVIKSIIKDSTSVGRIARVNSDYKDINVAILKATNHVEVLPKEKHVGIILAAVSGSRPRPDVAYCIQTLEKRLAKTHSWVVALKTLIIIHRAMREVDDSFFQELCLHTQHTPHFLNLRHFKDDSNPSACDCSSWIRTYALYIEECMLCFRSVGYNSYGDQTRTKKLDTPALLNQLPFLQQLLLRLLSCQPIGAARCNFMIQNALSIVAAESVRLYVAITDGVLILIDKFFEMQHRDAVPALEIYRRAVEQAHRLSDFFEMCRSLEFGQRQKYVRIEQPPESFLIAMEDYIKDAPQPLMLPWTSGDDCIASKLIAIPNPKEEGSQSSDDCEDTIKVALPLIPDLLSWDEPSEEASEPMAAPDESSDTTMDSSEATSWEHALATPPTPDTLCKGGVLDRSVLDRLYETATKEPNRNGGYQYHMPNASSNPFEADDSVYNQSTSHHHNMFNSADHSFMQQQGDEGRPMVVYDYMHNYHQCYLQQESSPHVDFSKLIVPGQQQQKPVAGNPFIEW